MSCCQQIFDFGRLSSLDGKLSLGVNATVAGVHTLEVDFLGTVLEIKTTLNIGNPIEFPVSLLNEKFTYIGRVYNPNKELVKKEVDAVLYECFSFETVIKYAIN